MRKNKVLQLLNSPFIIYQIKEKELFFELNPTQQKELKKLIPLIKYFYSFLNGQPDYVLLRKGLKNYFELYLSLIFQKLNLINLKYSFLDFGCGEGYYGKQFKKDNPNSKITFLDRNKGLKIDFEKTPNWYLKYKENFDCILLSELLHCKKLKEQIQIINQCNYILKPGGFIIINENEDIFMNFRLKKIKGAKMILPKDIYSLMKSFKLQKQIKIINHNIFLYAKV